MAERGYQDYQRVVNWDGASIINEAANKRAATFRSARIETSRYAYVMGKMQFSKRSVRVTFKWYMEESGGEPVGEREWYMDQATALSASIHIPSLGPWLEIVYESESAEEYVCTCNLFLSNRVTPYETMPVRPVIIGQGRVKLGAKVAHIFRPVTWWAGPAELSGFNTVKEGFLRLMVMQNSFTYEQALVESFANLKLPLKLILPFTAWYLETENAAAAEVEAQPVLIASTTGSS